MSQTSATAAALVVAFVIFITVRGELPKYFGALGIGPMPLQPGGSGATAAGGSGSGFGIHLASDGSIDLGLGSGPVRVDFPGYSPGFGYYGQDGVVWPDTDYACMDDPNCWGNR